MSFRIALRTLLRSPWHAAATIGTIALTVSLSSTVFAVVDGVLFKPLPYPAADRLHFVDGVDAKAARGTLGFLSALDVQYLAQADPRIGISPIGSLTLALDPDRPERNVSAGTAGPNFFDVLGLRPLMGGFLPEHFAGPSVPNTPRPAILTYQAWRRWLPDHPNPIGRALDLPGARLTVVGVLRADFVSVFGGINGIVAVVPLVTTPAAAADRWARGISRVLMRLPDDMTLSDATSRLNAAMAARATEYPVRKAGNPYVGVRVRAFAETLNAVNRRNFMVAFLGVVLLVLLGAVNVTALTVARAGDRIREFGLRAALGASRSALVQLWLAETTVVAITGGAFGLALAQPLLGVTASLLPSYTQILRTLEVDWRIAAFAFIAAVVPLVLTAMAPAITASRRAVVTNLAAGGRNSVRSRSWGRGLLLTMESAIGMTLVLVGSLVLAGYLLLRAEDVGFNPERLAVIELARVRGETSEVIQSRESLAFDRIRQAPGVRDVAIIGVPFLGPVPQLFSSDFTTQDRAGADAASANPMSESVYEVPISGAFFEIAGLRLVAGRYPTREEIDSGHPLAVVNELAAQAFWAERSPLGQTLNDGKQTVTVVGVVELAQIASQMRHEMAQIYFPVRLMTAPRRTVFLVQTAGNPQPVARAIGAALKRDIPGALVRRAESLDQALVHSEPSRRFDAALFGVAGGAALLLVTVGVGGLVATSVARRVRELGIRTALGARPAQLVRMVVTTQLRPVLVGLAMGLIASWWTSKLVYAYRYDAHDPRVWVAATAVLVGAAAIAAWIPARRASRVEPTVALRAE